MSRKNRTLSLLYVGVVSGSKNVLSLIPDSAKKIVSGLTIACFAWLMSQLLIFFLQVPIHLLIDYGYGPEISLVGLYLGFWKSVAVFTAALATLILGIAAIVKIAQGVITCFGAKKETPKQTKKP